jgi:cellulose synthase/poly-beta-1,6-N-acetylglucosamine synthase-like glycosyltransferase
MAVLDFLLDVYFYWIIVYFIGVNITYSILLVFSYREIATYMRRQALGDFRALLQSELTPAVSLLAPAFNEEATIVESVKSLLKLNYGKYEVVVVNDGSTDNTLGTMVGEFNLREVRQLYLPAVPAKPVRRIYRSSSREYGNLLVVDKENGGKADALNVGINVCSYEFFCAIDADSLLEEDALQKVIKPFLEDERVIASGGIVRIANGCEIVNGRVVSAGLSKKLLPIFQVVEYFRAFLSGRMGWQASNGLLIISGAFGMFRRRAVLEAGGYNPETVGEDMELVARLHRIHLEKKIEYRIVFVPDPVCWTQAPETVKVLSAQRNRWHRGLIDVVRMHGVMLMDKRYGVVGKWAMPYFFFVELLGPVFEFFGYASLVALALRGSLNLHMVVLFFIVSLLYGVMFSVGAVLLEELSFSRYPNPKHLALLLAMGVLENFGYRQMTVWWRVRSFYDYSRRKKGWGTMTRTGFTVAKK